MGTLYVAAPDSSTRNSPAVAETLSDSGSGLTSTCGGRLPPVTRATTSNANKPNGVRTRLETSNSSAAAPTEMREEA